MLARKYDNYAWEEEEVVVEQPSVPKRRLKKNTGSLTRRRIAILVGVVMVAYFISVVRSVAYMNAGRELVKLQREERNLINATAELKIEVEELKGPDRIIALAQQKLGMSVARSNIYVKGGAVQPK